MEKRVKYRVTGLCLAISFIAVLVFLLQSPPKTLPTPAADTIAPSPLADQAAPVTAPSITPPTVTDQTTQVSASPSALSSTQQINPSNNVVNVTPSTTMPNNDTQTLVQTPPSATAGQTVSTPIATTTNEQTVQPSIQTIVAPIHTHKSIAAVAKPKRIATIKKRVGIKTAINQGWIVQLGSFKNKANALRLVDKLRASGYHAFIQTIRKNTRVYVGPESQKLAALNLANHLNVEWHLSGVVRSHD